MMRAASESGWMPATFVVALAVLAVWLALRGLRQMTSRRVAMASGDLALKRGEPIPPRDLRLREPLVFDVS